MSAPREGWYPDPTDSGRMRRWDGGRWTEEVRPLPEATPGQPMEDRVAPDAPETIDDAGAGRPAMRRELVVAVSVLAALAVVVAALALMS